MIFLEIFSKIKLKSINLYISYALIILGECLMEGREIGKILNYFEKVGVCAIILTSELKLGDTIRVVGGESDFTQVIDSMQIDGKNVETAHAGEGVGIKISEKVGKGYRVYLVD